MKKSPRDITTENVETVIERYSTGKKTGHY